MPCVAGRIISDNDVFDSVLVPMGRMGIIYSMVLEVVDQFVLDEHRHQDSWQNVSSDTTLGAAKGSGTIGDLRTSKYFLQVLLLPYANSSGDHDCFVTTRAPQPHDAPLNPDPNKNNPFSAACRLQPLDKSLVVLGIIAAADAGAAAAVAVSVALAPLLVTSITIGDYIAAVTNLMTQFGLIDVAKQTVTPC